MTDLLFTLVFLLVPTIALVLMRLFNLSLFRVSIPEFVIVSMFVFSYVGLLPLYFGWDEYRYETVNDKSLIFIMLLCSGWAIISMILGFAFVQFLIGKVGVGRDIRSISVLGGTERLFVWLLLGVCVAVLLLYLSQLSNIALFVALSADATNVDMWTSRSAMGNDFGGKYYRYSIFMHDTLYFLGYVFFAIYLLKKSIFNLVCFVSVFLITSFSALMTIEKGPFMWFIIGLYLMYVLVEQDGRYPVRGLSKLFTVAFGVLIILYLNLFDSTTIEGAAISIMSRVFTGGVTPAYYYMEYFPEVENFLYGRSFPNPGGIFPFEPFPLTQTISSWKFPQNYDFGIVGSAPTVFWAEIYANFGYVGVAIAPFYVGAALYLLSVFLEKLPASPVTLGLAVWAAIHFQFLSQTGISMYLVDTYFIAVYVFGLAIALFGNRGKLRFN